VGSVVSVRGLQSRCLVTKSCEGSLSMPAETGEGEGRREEGRSRERWSTDKGQCGGCWRAPGDFGEDSWQQLRCIPLNPRRHL